MIEVALTVVFVVGSPTVSKPSKITTLVTKVIGVYVVREPPPILVHNKVLAPNTPVTKPLPVLVAPLLLTETTSEAVYASNWLE